MHLLEVVVAVGELGRLVVVEISVVGGRGRRMAREQEEEDDDGMAAARGGCHGWALDVG